MSIPSSFWIRKLLVEEDGQDIMEYALLAAFIGLVGVVAWTNIQSEMTSHYQGWGTGVNQISSCTPDPIASGLTTCSGGS